MTHLYKAFYGALLVLGLASITPGPALAGGYHWDPGYRCIRPDYQYTTRQYVRALARVITHRRVVNHTRYVRGHTRLVQENRVLVHVRPVINREVIVHRTNTVVRDVVLHRVNRINVTATNTIRRWSIVTSLAGSGMWSITARCAAAAAVIATDAVAAVAALGCRGGNCLPPRLAA
jgi:hypothetical protein